ncbi:hypothetical protein [Cerasicoccus fimbriatus]|uniref:hypothetical protein n=1 Tax=Cerasicoccus fimbriatus TaxID=3014554 RepID=UPI0022B339D5|nr:hypothetical protein [Cerasicoccus sp. TK19100]
MKASLYCLFALLGTQIASADSIISIPLQKDTITLQNESTKVAYGLYVKVGDGGHHRLFQLDTGSAAFMAGYSSSAGANQFWGSFDSISGAENLGESFGSGVEFYPITPVHAKVTLSNSTGSDLFSFDNVRVGQVKDATNAGPGDWVTDLNNGQPPLHNKYFGNFGGRLSTIGSGSVNEQSVLFSALGQIEGVKGFSIRLDGGNETLRVIMNDSAGQSYADQFSFASLMPTSGEANFPISGLPTYSDAPAAPDNFAVEGSQVDGASGIFDTGGVAFKIPETPQLPSNLLEDGAVIPGANFEIFMSGAGMVDGQNYEDYVLSFTTTDDANNGKVEQSSPGGGGAYNFGTSIYHYYEVMYDLEDGVMRFRAIPEPRAIAMGALCFLGVLLLRRRQSQRHG